MKKSLLTLSLSVACFAGIAQQDVQFSQNMFNKLAINPGYAGTSRAICATLFYRNQWMGFDGAPKTILFSGDAYIPKIHGGLGLTFFNDQLGFDKSNHIKLAYSFNQPIGPGVLGIGVEGGVIMKSLAGAWLAPTDYTKDAAIPGDVSSTTYDVGFGIYYATQQLYVGVSSTHLPESELTASVNNKKLQFTNVRHYYVTAGYAFPLGNPDWELEPSVFVKSDAASTQFDGNLRVIYQKTFWGGVSYRLTDAICPMIGFQKSGFKIGFSYDVTTSDIKNYSSGTVEAMVGYCFKVIPPVKKQSHQNVRFL